MTSLHKYLLCASRFAALLLLVSSVACGKSDGEGGAPNSVEWDPAVTVRPNEEYYTALLLSGRSGTPWTAQIVSGSDWVKFTGQQIETSGTYNSSVQAAREVFVYYKANPTNEERSAEVLFTFEGQPSVTLLLVQYSITSNKDVYTTGHNLAWPEIPSKSADSKPYRYVTHFAPMYNTATSRNYNARNYTLCFDGSKRASWWVAYPLYDDHTGKLPRPDPDPWAYDPKLEAVEQANLTRGSYNRGSDGNSYDRGHQLPNADRNGISAMQYQTFYCSNATPQNSTLNQRAWASLEGMVRNWICTDTLYVVTGAYWANGSVTTTDKSGSVCPVPTHYFKVLLRTKGGSVRTTGDKIDRYNASQLISIGFLVDNRSATAFDRNWIRSVKEIEDFTGFTFFPTLNGSASTAVKGQRNPTDWGIN